jgi:hypothetical protein
MPALIDDDLTLFSGKADWESYPVLTPDPSGFDSVTAVLCFRGTGQQLSDLLPRGGLSCPDFAGKPLFYKGPRVTEAKFGYQIAELTWLGMAEDPWSTPPVSFLGANAYVRSINISMTTEESLWPRDAAGNSLYLGAPYAPTTNGLRTFTAIGPDGSTIVTGQLPWRVRLIGRAWTVRMSGIIAGPRAVIVKPPKCMVPNPALTDASAGLSQINWLATGDPLVTWSADAGSADGWVCRNYDTSQETPIGSVFLARWEAVYQWVERYGP